MIDFCTHVEPAVREASEQRAVDDGAAGSAKCAFVAGGTTLVDLMKLDVERPARVIDINLLAA